MALQDVLQGFQSLANTVKEIAMGNAVQKAQLKAEEVLKRNDLNEFEKIRAQQAIANEVATGILGQGGDAARAHQARMSLAPQIPDQFMAQLEGTGKPTIGEASAELRKQDREARLKEIRTQRQLMLEQKELELEAKKDIAGLQMEAKLHAPMSAKETTELSGLANQVGNWQETGRQARKLGTIKLDTPEWLNSTQAKNFQRLKNASDAVLRNELFGATLTNNELAAFKGIIGTMASAVTAADLASGYEALAQRQKQLYVDRLKNKTAPQKQLLENLVANRGIFTNEEGLAVIKELKRPRANMESVEELFGAPPVRIQMNPAESGYSVQQDGQAPAAGGLFSTAKPVKR